MCDVHVGVSACGIEWEASHSSSCNKFIRINQQQQQQQRQQGNQNRCAMRKSTSPRSKRSSKP